MIRGFTAGAFDLLHPGHLAFLTECRNSCDQLIVALHVDPSKERVSKNKPVQSVFERWYQLDECKSVDLIIPYETEADLHNLIATVAIDIRFLGSDYEGVIDQITGWDLCVDEGIDIHFIPRRHTFSSSDLRGRLEKLPDCTRADEIAAQVYSEKHYSKGFATGGIGKADIVMTMTEGFNLSPGVSVKEYDD